MGYTANIRRSFLGIATSAALLGCAVFVHRPSVRSPASVAACDLPTSSQEFIVANVQMSFKTLASPYRLEIVSTPFAKRTKLYGQYINSRRALGENPLSDRKYWAKKAPIQPSYRDDAAALFPEMFVEERFAATLSLEKPSESEWAKLGYIIGQEPILTVFAFPRIWAFAQTSAKCFDRPVFSKSLYGKFAQQHVDKFLSQDQNQILSEKQIELYHQLNANQYRPIEKLRYYASSVGNNPLIVTHPSREFDDQMIAKPGIDKAIAQARRENRRVIYLMQYDNVEDITQYYFPERNDLVMYSSQGEHSFTPANNEATVVGNFFGLCQGEAVQDVITRYFLGKSNGTFKVTVPLAATRTHYQDAHPVDKAALMTTDVYLQKAGTAAFKKLVEKYFFKPTHFGSDEYFAYGPGPEFKMVSTEEYRVKYTDYSFTAYLDGRELLKKGSGPRHVHIYFLSK